MLSLFSFHPSPKQQRPHVAGFTLVETVLYVTFTALALLLSGTFLLDILHSKATLSAVETVAREAEFAFGEIGLRLSSSDTVVAPAPSLTETMLTLSIEGSPVNLFLDEGVLTMTSLSGTERLTSPEVTVTDLEFTNVAPLGTPPTVRIRMTLCREVSGTRFAEPICASFHTARGLRTDF